MNKLIIAVIFYLSIFQYATSQKDSTVCYLADGTLINSNVVFDGWFYIGDVEGYYWEFYSDYEYNYDPDGNLIFYYEIDGAYKYGYSVDDDDSETLEWYYITYDIATNLLNNKYMVDIYNTDSGFIIKASDKMNVVTLYDTKGTVLSKSKTLSNETTVNTNYKGILLVKIDFDNTSITKKVSTL